MYTRTLSVPNHSFFLFGPRSTGKTTWLKQTLPAEGTTTFDFLLDDVLIPLLQQRELFRQRVEASNPGWIFIDEVQKFPAVLNDVHHLIQKYPDKRYKFAISSSSARKLKRLDSNLLAGRVIKRDFFPLTIKEIGANFDLDTALQFGMLPKVVSDPEFAIDILEAYTGTYVTQEINQETLIRDIATFARFLRIAAIMNSEILNVSNIARDAAIGRTTAQRYFEILVDTLIGWFVYPWQSKIKVKEVAHPKFYLFDPGVARSLSGYLREPVGREESGALLETLVLHELRAWSCYTNSGGDIFYWRTTAGKEVDFIWSRGATTIGIEVKSSKNWRREWSKPLLELLAAKRITKAFGIYRGTEILKEGALTILPVEEFATRLYQNLFELA